MHTFQTETLLLWHNLYRRQNSRVAGGRQSYYLVQKRYLSLVCGVFHFLFFHLFTCRWNSYHISLFISTLCAWTEFSPIASATVLHESFWGRVEEPSNSCTRRSLESACSLHGLIWVFTGYLEILKNLRILQRENPAWVGAKSLRVYVGRKWQKLTYTLNRFITRRLSRQAKNSD